MSLGAATVKAPAFDARTVRATARTAALSAIPLTADNAVLVLGIIPRSPRVPRDVQALITLADFGAEGAEVLASLAA